MDYDFREANDSWYASDLDKYDYERHDYNARDFDSYDSDT